MKVFVAGTILLGLLLPGASGEDALPLGEFRKVPQDGPQVRQILRIKPGRFEWYGPSGHRPIQQGVYEVRGPRIFLIGDDPSYGEVLFLQNVDGVYVLLDDNLFARYRSDLSIFTRLGECYVLFNGSGGDGDVPARWEELLKLHPKFRKVLNDAPLE